MTKAELIENMAKDAKISKAADCFLCVRLFLFQ